MAMVVWFHVYHDCLWFIFLHSLSTYRQEIPDFINFGVALSSLEHKHLDIAHPDAFDEPRCRLQVHC